MVDKKSTILKKDKKVDIKTQKGSYSYKFTTIAEIHRYLEETGQHYEAFIQPEEKGDYLFIQKLDKEGKKIGESLRCTKIPQVADLKAYGGALTTCRRYSLLMAFGLACEDDDEPVASSVEETKDKWRKMHTANPNNPVSTNQKIAIKNLCEGLGKSSEETLKIITSLKNAAEASKKITELGDERTMFEELKNAGEEK